MGIRECGRGDFDGLGGGIGGGGDRGRGVEIWDDDE